MSDTDKYEGHAEGDWHWQNSFGTMDTHGYVLMDTHGSPIAELTEGWNTKEATAQLIADAPDLLAEVKRLRRGIHFALSYTKPTPHTDDPWMACREFIVKYLESLIAEQEREE